MANILFGRPGSDGQMKDTPPDSPNHVILISAPLPLPTVRPPRLRGRYSRINGDNERVEQWLEVVSWELRAFLLCSFFLRSYGKDIINIHHGLLPSFSRSNPSKQSSLLPKCGLLHRPWLDSSGSENVPLELHDMSGGNQWSIVFFGIVSRAMTIEVLSTGVAGNNNGALQVPRVNDQLEHRNMVLGSIHIS
ncbi:hypothetical protein JHK86_006661 [Glycine max]|nr:hypothetical protein JHK86_006661 [Glycine max]